MRSSNLKILAATVVLLIASRAHAQNSDPPAYLNPSLPAQRAADLVHRMTVEEKVTQLTNQSRAIERLHIPAYKSEYLPSAMIGSPASHSHGVGNVPGQGNEDPAGIGTSGNGILYSKTRSLAVASKFRC